MFPLYDIIVVGAGHAGCEAAAAAAKMGSKTLLVTMNMQSIAQMSCNPAMGGVAKGQIVREIDALGGYSGIVSDISAVQFRMLNRSKGPAMWSPRTQNDRILFATTWREMLERIPNIDFWQDMVSQLIIEKNKVVGIITSMGLTINAKAVILTNGTFLNGIIHIGEKQIGGGRVGEKSSTGITEQLITLGFESGRMKTGTPPRLDGRSLDYSKMEIQKGDSIPNKFSFSNEIKTLTHQLPCYVTYTNNNVHEILASGFDKSPMFAGRIQGLGPRYCPSIEDKITRFAERERHQIFVEPEGWNTVEIYVNGFSTSLPEEIQYKAMKLIPGFENMKMFRPGYAIEYDYFPPTQLKYTLETKHINNLYFAGQINGTTGYEEAACQGLMAGINAHLKLNNNDELVLKRDQAYIGVLIDDLINKGTDEPYRMFTSRSEFRTLLRQDNADLRLSAIGHKIGLLSNQRMIDLEQKKININEIINWFKDTSISPDDVNNYISDNYGEPIRQKVKIKTILSRPETTIKGLVKSVSFIKKKLAFYTNDEIEQAEINIKYEGYLNKEKEFAQRLQKLDEIPISHSFDYHKLQSLSIEAREKLTKIRPTNLGQASRISGISPTDISIIMIYIGR